MRTALTLIILVLAGTGGDIAVAHAMKRLGELHSFSPMVIVRFLGRAFLEGWMWIGILQLTLAFCSLLFLLSWEAVSFVVPAMALSYVTGAIGGKYFLGEKLTPWRWAGIALVSVGVALVCLG
jgi:drug/metabolite transporter (DMT)-like permease